MKKIFLAILIISPMVLYSQQVITTPHGTTTIGAHNVDWSHFQTDRPKFFFEKPIYVQSGIVSSYVEDLHLAVAGAAKMTIGHATGNVGIGTLNPNYRLHVVTGQNWPSAIIHNTNKDAYSELHLKSDVSSVVIGSTGSNYQEESFRNSSYIYSLLSDHFHLKSSGDLNFYTGGTTQDKKRMTIDTSGNVGIGTFVPDARLDLGLGTGDGGAKFLWYNDAPGIKYGGTKSGIYLDLPGRGSNNVNLVFATSSANEGRFSISSKDTTVNSIDAYIDRVSVLGNGNVGIGTTTPKAQLDILANSDYLGWSEPITFSNDRNAAITHHSSGLMFGFHKNVYEPHKAGSFYFGDLNGGSFQKYIMKIEGDTGNVGIGTLTPDARLVVNGTIKATKISVVETIAAADFKIAGSDEWADYVFSEDYNLRSLSEVDNFINENGHLPEMPTAEEVSANGYELAKVNALLLKKIEELTLYTIELDKKIAALEGNK